MEGKMKTLNTILSVVIFTAASIAQPQPPDTVWTRTYGDSLYNIGTSICLSSDGGYLITGDLGSNSMGDIIVMKIDSVGNEEWCKTYCDTANIEGHYITTTFDGNYIVVGRIYNSSSHYDILLMKIDEFGNEIWSRTFSRDNDDFGIMALQTNDQGYVILGNTYISLLYNNRDIWIIKTDSLGYFECEWLFGGEWSDTGSRIYQTLDGGIIISGNTISYGAGMKDIWIIKLDSVYNVEWDCTYGGSDYEDCNDCRPVSDGGYVILGSAIYTFTGVKVVWFFKIDSSGNEQWGHGFGCAYDMYIGGARVLEEENGEYTIVGYRPISVFGDTTDVWVLRTDNQGNEIWNIYIGGYYYDYGYDIQHTIDNGYIIIGRTNSFGAGSYDVYVIRLSEEGSLVEDFYITHPSSFILYPSYPNPFNTQTLITFDLPSASLVELVVYNVAGRKVISLAGGEYEAGTHQVHFDGSELSSGIYFIRLKAGEQIQTQKCLLIR